jgi:dipeptidyl aminopeptidase/acylaminoacyl peptidase
MQKPIRARDGQQWIYDYVLKASGRAVHYEYDVRDMPKQAKSIRMVSKYLVKEGEHSEKMARGADAAGDTLNARKLYRLAAEHYKEAQHFLIPPTSPKRWDILKRAHDCARRAFSLADYRIELVEIPYRDTSIPGVLHLAPGEGAKPTVIFIPGMDNTKENYPNIEANPFIARGMNLLCIDGPGQGEALMRGIHVHPGDHSVAASNAYDFLSQRADVDESRIGISGRSFGTYWSLRAAAEDGRFACVGGAVACYYWDRLTIFQEVTIRFKQVFMAMAGTEDEEAFDKECEGYTLKGFADKVTCPVLMGIGEFDPLNPLEDAEAVFEALAGPKEMWIFEDEFHRIRAPKNLGGGATYDFIAQWMLRAMNGHVKEGHAKKRFVKLNGDGFYD